MAIHDDPPALTPGGRMAEVRARDREATTFEGLVRDASEADMAAVSDIYAHYVLHSLATFEETPPTREELLARRRASVERGLPYLVAESHGKTLGFAYAAEYRARPAYRFTIEDSVYVAEGLSGQGTLALRFSAK
jgi:L-amino acid N-acyltransferase YncA